METSLYYFLTITESILCMCVYDTERVTQVVSQADGLEPDLLLSYCVVSGYYSL